MRINITIPEYLLHETDVRAKALGISRSAYIAASLQQKAQYDDMFKVMPQVIEKFNQLAKDQIDSKLKK